MTQDQMSKISAAIIAAMDSDKLPAWRRPWRTLRSQGVACIPQNAVTGRAYRGANVFILWARGDADMRYLTYRQAQSLGGHVKRGEKGTQVIFWKKNRYTKRNEVTGEDEKRDSLLMRFYTVFNVAQCEGLTFPKPRGGEDVVAPAPTPTVMAEVYAAVGATVRHGGDNAFYAPGPDTIQMPVPEAFTEADAYAATALHELTHWTGHNDRLKRDFTGRFGTKAYAAEELVAEFGAAFLCAALGVNSALEHHASYLDNWRQLLKDDPKALITASSKAQAAADYLLAKIKPEAATAEDEEGDEEQPLAIAA